MPAKSRFEFAQKYEEYTDYDARAARDMIRRVTLVQHSKEKYAYLTFANGTTQRITWEEGHWMALGHR